MKTKFDWKTSPAAFTTFKKLLYLSMHPLTKTIRVVSQDNKPMVGNLMNNPVEHSELVKFSKQNRAVISEHLEGFIKAGLVDYGFKGKNKFYMLSYKFFRQAQINTVFLLEPFLLANNYEEYISLIPKNKP